MTLSVEGELRRSWQVVASLGAALLVTGICRTAWSANPAPQTVEFNRDIRPILSDTCFHCHGPDKAKRKADLRFDTEEGAFADLAGHFAIVRGDVEHSEMYRRLVSQDENERMPPPKSGRKVTPQQIELIRLWIAQGAKWQKHWSLIPPVRPPIPAVTHPQSVRNPIDAFVLSRLEREGLTPSPAADKTTLIRRVTLDLTGLPPTPAEVDAFLADQATDAYEKVVDRLLKSPRYGERMATRWLDAARYADTNGYQSDGIRYMWRWRDWVINAFNQNMPFDRFTIEQLAGDMLPNPTLDQRIATGFNRNHRGNAEGGIIPEEYLVEYVVDRVDTTATVWLGLTMGYARCHDHKYDPISQKEYYQVFACFNNVPERGKAVKYGNSPPMIKAPTLDEQTRMQALESQLVAAEESLAKMEPELVAAQTAWENSVAAMPSLDWINSRGLVVHYELNGDATDKSNDSKLGKFEGGDPAYAPGLLGQAGDFDGKRYLDAGDVANFGYSDKFTCAAWVFPKSADESGAIFSRMEDNAYAQGYNLHWEAGRVQVNFCNRWLDDAIRVETVASFEPNRWHHVAMTYDGSQVAAGIKIYVDGKLEKHKIYIDELNITFSAKQPLRIGSRGTQNRFVGLIDDARIYNYDLTSDEIEVLSISDSISAILAIPPGQRTPAQAKKVRTYFLELIAPEPVRQARKQLADLRKQKRDLVEGFPSTMVMQESEIAKETFILLRGEYDKRGEKVAPGVPANMSASPATVGNRLDVARWLVDGTHPLTARVAVNRYWQMYFGTGLVKTVDDFGSQGEWPSHPDLLDWLATEFVSPTTTPGAVPWDVKALQRLIVTSATYRQSSKVTPALLQRDPENRLLARGPRIRLSAETIRDQSLAVSGLLVEKLGGPSVMPYQPKGLWKELADTDFTQDHGENLYRRSMYTFWKRTIAPPSMMTFDAAGREACSVRETRTNTPLQALTLMNEVTYVEAARLLAERMMTTGGSSPEERITLAFRLILARAPNPLELKILLGGFQNHLARYRQNTTAAQELVSAGEAPRNTHLDPSELAAYTVIASLILNLDEAITKE